MDTNQSAFAAYKQMPTKFVEKQKTPKKSKSKSKNRDKTPGKADAFDDTRMPAKKRVRPNDADNVATTNSASSEHLRFAGTTNGTHNGKTKKSHSKEKHSQRRVEERKQRKHPTNDVADKTKIRKSGKMSSSLSHLPIAVVPDSVKSGMQHFSYVVNPVKLEEFMSDYWEKKPLCVNRSVPNYYKELLSVDEIDKMLRTNLIEYTKNIDVTSYVDGVRETHNPEGRASPTSVWEFYRDGCSIRLLNPQTYIPNIRKLNASIQEYFHCMTGANVYLTPPNSQGFAPHYDDIEAFVLQVEGKKIWRLYAPRTQNDMLARVSSGNFKPEEIGEPILEKTLEAGDLMYFPRGTIHEARTVPGSHSLHITLSVYQKTSFGDLLEILLPQALQTAIDSDIEFRRGLPLNIWREFGLVNSSTESRREIAARMKSLFGRIIQHADLDSAVDQMALKYQHDALPPEITSHEQKRTVYGTKTRMNANGEMEDIKIDEDTEFRLLRANIIRMIYHENSLRVYFYADNSKEYHEYDLNYVEVEADLAPVIECLIKSYPNYVRLNQMPLSLNESFTIVFELWGRGVLMTRDPLTQ